MEKENLLEDIKRWKQFAYNMYYLERYGDWIVFLKARAGECFKKVSIPTILKVITTLQTENDFEKANKELIAGTTKQSFKNTLNGIAYFSKKGPEFYFYACPNITPANRQFMEILKRENERYAKMEAQRKSQTKETTKEQ